MAVVALILCFAVAYVTHRWLAIFAAVPVALAYATWVGPPIVFLYLAPACVIAAVVGALVGSWVLERPAD